MENLALNLALTNSAKCQRSSGKKLCQNNLIHFLTVTKRNKNHVLSMILKLDKVKIFKKENMEKK